MTPRNQPQQLALPPPPDYASLAAIPDEMSHPGPSLQQILVRLRANLRRSVMIFVGLLVVSAIAIKLLPRVYVATASLIVNYDINDPLSGKEFPIGLLGSYTSTQIEIMQSAEVLMPVIKRLKLTERKEFAAGYSGDPAALPNYVQEQLLKALTIEAGHMGSQLIHVTASVSDPVLAANIANGVADIYAEQHLHRLTGPASERAERYSQQLAELKSKVDNAQAQISKFRRDTGVTDVTAGNADTEEALLISLEQKYLDAQNLRRAADVRQSSNQALSPEVMNSLLVQNLKGQLNNQEAQMAQMRATLGPQHPKIVELQSQIDATRRALSNEVGTYSGNSASELASARQLEEKYRRAVEEQKARVIAKRSVKDEASKLVLELQSAESVYKRALDGYDQIMFATSSRYTNVEVASHAEPPLKSAKPDKPKLIILAAIMSLLISVVGPLFYEMVLNRRVRCVDDLERDLNLLVLADFSRVPEEAAT